jgi:hypothetical protein
VTDSSDRIHLPINQILNDDDDAGVTLAQHNVHHDAGVTLMVNIAGEARTVWLDPHDLEQLAHAVGTARGWLGEPSRDGAAAAADLVSLAQHAVDAVITAADQLGATLDPDGYALSHGSGAAGERVDPWMLYVLAEHFSTVIEQATFPLEELAVRAEELGEVWSTAQGLTANRDAELAMATQLARAGRTLRRAATLGEHAAAAALQPELEALNEDLEVRLRLPDSDPPRFVDVRLVGWEHDTYAVRDASNEDRRPLHERELHQSTPAGLADTIAEVAGLDFASVPDRIVASTLALEAHDRLTAMAKARDSGRRHTPSGRLASDPPPPPVPWAAPRRPEPLTTALEDLADRDGQRAGVPALGPALALALALAAADHPDGEAGLLAHPDQDERSAELIRALVTIGRRRQSGDGR